MTIESEDRTEPHVEAASASAADDAADAATEDEAAAWHNRAPWKYVFPMLLIALIWIVIGLVCSPTDFRF